VIKMSKVSATIPSTTGGRVPASLSQIGTITKYELVNYFRSRRFFILLAIGLIISGLLTGLVAYLGVGKVAPCQPATCSNPVLAFYSFWWGNSITLVIVLSGIFFGGDAISGEFQNKTGYFLVGNPLRRSSIYIGKWLGALIASVIVLAIYAGITVGNGLYYFGANLPYQFTESLSFSMLYLIAVLGFTFFFSSLFKSSSMSILVTAILFLFAFSLIQLIVSGLAQIEPWFIITYGSGIIGNVLMDPYPTTQPIRGAGGGGREAVVFSATIPEGIMILLAYFVVTAILGLILFERKEFT
jgi:ABC-2 type transport system permease protein